MISLLHRNNVHTLEKLDWKLDWKGTIHPTCSTKSRLNHRVPCNLREINFVFFDRIRALRIFRWTLTKKVPASFSLKELISLLKSLRSGWGPPLEMAARMLNSKFWVMEADVWADLLIVCCWANPTIYCEKCDKDVESTTTSCNHVVCPVCVVGQGIGPIRCPECGETLTALLFTSALPSTQENPISKLLISVCCVNYMLLTIQILMQQGSVVFVSHQQLPLRDHVLTQVSSQFTV